MTTPQRRTAGQATADQLVATAERLFAERGLEAVSLREIGKEAGSRNTGVAHHHFGGKEGLVRAIIAARAPALNERRLALLAEATATANDGPIPPEALVRVLVLPLVEELERGSHYVAFLARLAAENPGTPWIPGLDDDSARSYRQVLTALGKALPGLDRRRFRHRSDLLVQLIVGSVAARQRAEALGTARVSSRPAFVDDLLEAATGLLLAPVGAARTDPRIV